MTTGDAPLHHHHGAIFFEPVPSTRKDLKNLCFVCERVWPGLHQMTVVRFTVAVLMMAMMAHARQQRECGTLDLDSSLTRHCFPEGGGEHSTCCVDINLPKRELDMVLTCIRTRTLPMPHARTHTRTHAHTHAQTKTKTHTDTDKRTRTRTRTRTEKTHTHAQTQTQTTNNQTHSCFLETRHKEHIQMHSSTDHAKSFTIVLVASWKISCLPDAGRLNLPP